MLNPEILEKVRATVSRLKRNDLTGVDTDSALELDSIVRISLIAELENAFEIEFLDSDLTPEAFASLGSLTNLVQKHVA